MRAIQNDDIWAALRGCQMMSSTADELRELMLQHTKHTDEMLFADFVILEAARQALAIKGERS